MALGITKIERLENGNILLSVKNTVKKAFLPNVGLDTLSDTTVRLLDLNGANSYDFTWQTVKEVIVDGAPLVFSVKNVGEFIRFIFSNVIFVPGSGGSTTGLATENNQLTQINSLEEILDEMLENNEAKYSGFTFNLNAPNSGTLTLPANIGQIDVSYTDGTSEEIFPSVISRVENPQDVVDVLNRNLSQVIFNVYNNTVLVFEDGDIPHNNIAAITIYNDDASEFMTFNSFSVVDEDLSRNQQKIRRLLQQISNQSEKEQGRKNHVYVSQTGSGPTTIPAGFYSLLVVRLSGTFFIDGTIRLNNQLRSFPVESQQTKDFIGGTPQTEITGTGQWAWIAMNNLI
mgnify:CR=1 FL=1